VRYLSKRESEKMTTHPPITPLPTGPEAAIDRLNEILRGYPDDSGQRAEIERQRDEIMKKMDLDKRW
jgi:hypothetical protein